MTLESALSEHGVSSEDIERAKQFRAKVGGSLEKILLNMGSLSEELLPSIYARFLECEVLTPAQRDAWEPPKEPTELPQAFLRANGWLLFEIMSDGVALFVTKAPMNWDVWQYLTNENIAHKYFIASESDFELLETKMGDDIQGQNTAVEGLSDAEEYRLRELASEAPTVNLLNNLITRALRMRASDMHIEPVDGRYRVRYRIDGVLHDIEFLPERLQLLILSRLKILAGMDIAEKRRPQDGKIEMRVANIALDIRVSALPVNKGESMVLRFLRKDALTYDMSSLGFVEDTHEAILRDLKRTSGVILMTGPTGSGKTTTLYSFLNQINGDDVKIVTLEDPVEYQLPGLNQVHVRPEIGFDFSSGLRSIVRQDPDVIMVGEVRDKETCRIAMQAALTGHLVFSTVHTNDAPSAFTRLLDLGVEEYLLNAALISILAQRLVRQLCPTCKSPLANPRAVIKEHGLSEIAERFGSTCSELMASKGCEDCANTGFKGRLAVIEYFPIDDKLKSIPKDDQFLIRAKSYNRERGWRTLLEDGLLLALEGKTTVEEVYRVCG